MGIFPVRTPERIPHQDRPRDMAKIIHNATDRGDPIDEVAADHYGKRPTRYEHEDVVLSNEYLAMAAHIDNTMAEFLGEVDLLKEFATALKGALRDRVIDLTALVTREKAVVADLQGHFKDLHARITETRIAKPAPALRSNGNGAAHANSEPSAEGATTQEVPVEKDTAVVQTQAPVNRKGK